MYPLRLEYLISQQLKTYHLIGLFDTQLPNKFIIMTARTAMGDDDFEQ